MKIHFNVWINETFFRKKVYILFILISKTEELDDIAKSTNAAIIGICESKLDASVLDPEISIDNYKILRFDRNRLGGGVACYVRNDLGYKILSVFPLSFPVMLKTFSLKMSNVNVTRSLASS